MDRRAAKAHRLISHRDAKIESALMRVTLKSLALPAIALLSFAVIACGGGGGDDTSSEFPEVIEVGDETVQAEFLTNELVVGENRFSFGLLDDKITPIVDATVKVQVYDLANRENPVLTQEADAISVVPARDAGLEETVEHIHTDGSRHLHSNAGDDVGVYVAQLNFDKVGIWGVAVEFEDLTRGIRGTLRYQFNVIDQSSTPRIGSPAPRTVNKTAADVEDITEIDSSNNPSEEMHTSTIADAIAAGKPTLVLFAVPGFCTSRFCGPELEIMRKLYPEYRDRMEFIHVEFYEDPGNPDRVPVDAVAEWGLRSEPWFFVIDSEGLISAKFEGPTGMTELKAALDAVAGG
jgi:hypothetical protein